MHPRDYSNIKRLTYQEQNPNSWSLENLDILLHLDSFCLGDTICFSCFLDDFVKKYKPKSLKISTFWKEIFDEKYQFIDATTNVHLYVDKLVNIGFHKEELNHVRNGMIWAVKNIMGLNQDIPLLKPPLKKLDLINKKKKITIATESLKKIAKWDRANGWEEVIKTLLNAGFEIHNVSYEKTTEIEGVIYHDNNNDISEALHHIAESVLFIGLSSGLSWLAWSYDVPVVMISGFTKHYNEFPCYRVINERACNGCFNILKNISNECPLFLNTERQNECHNMITPDMVLTQVANALKDNYQVSLLNLINQS